MVKSVLSVAHSGLRDWIIQRLTALVMAAYTIGFFAYLICHTDLSYGEWRAIFELSFVKVSTILFLLSIMFHAWIGMWTIFTDYVKPYVLRAILNALTILMLAACFVWGVMILWSV